MELTRREQTFKIEWNGEEMDVTFQQPTTSKYEKVIMDAEQKRIRMKKTMQDKESSLFDGEKEVTDEDLKRVHDEMIDLYGDDFLNLQINTNANLLFLSLKCWDIKVDDKLLPITVDNINTVRDIAPDLYSAIREKSSEFIGRKKDEEDDELKNSESGQNTNQK